MKERRRKKILAENGLLPDPSVPIASSTVNKKRQRPSDNGNADDNNQDSNCMNNTDSSARNKAVIHVTVPDGLSAKEAKKFRKDARRKARTGGNEAVQFVKEGDEPQLKKLKRTFPCINELVKQERRQQKESATQQAEDDLSDDYKTRYVALDCEMVGIGSEGRQSALARVSIVNWVGETLLDTFVQVPTKVTDFRTFVSGVKPKHIQSATAMDVKKCRETVAALIKGKILVGHALKNDLHALMLQHPATHIRDTARYRPFQRLAHNKKWRPRKLRDLVQENCNITIQQAGQSHDSVDDAKATMELFKTVHAAWEKELELKAKKTTSSR